MQFAAPLLADAEWIKVVIPIVVFTIITLNRLFGGEGAAKKMQQKRPVPAPPQPPPPGGRQQVDDEVAEFLRRATQGKQQRPTPPPPKPARSPEQEATKVRRLAPKRDEAAPLYEDDPPESRRAPVGTRIGEKKPAARNRTEAPRPNAVDQADEAMEAHIHQSLDHQVGNLADMAPTATSDQVPLADDTARSVGQLLRNPQSIREAIIVSEILRRPTHRW